MPPEEQIDDFVLPAMTPSEQICYLEMLTGYLQLPILTPSRQGMRGELDALAPALKVSTEASQILLQFGDPDLLTAYAGTRWTAFVNSLGSVCPFSILGVAPGGRSDTLRAARLLKDDANDDHVFLCDAALRLAIETDDPDLAEQICDLLGISFDIPGKVFSKRTPWHRDTPKVHAWTEKLMRKADLSTNDWQGFVNTQLIIAEPRPFALMIACGINPRRVCPDHSFAPRDWCYTLWESLSNSHGVLGITARLPAFTEICRMPSQEIVALLRSDA